MITGRLILNAEKQIEIIENNKFDNLKRFTIMSFPSKTFNHRLNLLFKLKNIKSYYILTISQRLNRSIEASSILLEKLDNYSNLTRKNNDEEVWVKPFNLSLFNTSVLSLDEKIRNKYNNNLVSFYIPKTYDDGKFPLYFTMDNYEKCAKIIDSFINHIIMTQN